MMMKNLFRNCRADSEWILMPFMFLMMIIVLFVIIPSNNSQQTELAYTGTVSNVEISYGNGSHDDLTKVSFIDNTTITFHQQIGYLLVDHTYTFRYYEPSFEVIQVQSAGLSP
jgi:hypothetical protein